MNWKTAYLETRLSSASPVELVNILYEYAIAGVQDARVCLAQRDIPRRSAAILKVISILGELERSLDHKTGRDIAANLARLYRYMRERLTTANLQQKDEPLAEVEGLLKTLGEPWRVIGRKQEVPVDDALRRSTPAGYGAGPMQGSLPEYVSHSWSA